MRQDQKDTKDQLGRRQFFRALGGGTVAAAVGVAATPMTATDAQAYDPGQDETKGRYRLTDHVKAFYRTNGYETLQNSSNAAGKK
ncbi:hypothetical protein PMNALOAF_0888 [Methylobacterium adhaesivum]|jgi:hypothetical protein|uniref:Formate dehydrogenase n=1 Tax=Methylobacterium adhaesivum TaxID=333297 RepID=A0ABT8BFR3_9HYPH|nr:formate dehydrogenase [Methylobacterium adhaesivum]MDN3590959.1 formate dehydrogenase [Methylobacterium adhaesivum]GJD29652.1 hypothetical protein PMNALOAF_0888 [Methylobacterium adhaesivum]